MTPTGETARAGVMGWPVAHSLSPRLHGFWLDLYGIDGAYEPIAVPPEEFEGAIHSLAGTGFRGVNLTIPHKEAGLKVCDEVGVLARRIGAVNTVVFEAGRLVGSNTDAFGFIENLHHGAPGWNPAAGPAFVLGGGGAAKGCNRSPGVPCSENAQIMSPLADDVWMETPPAAMATNCSPSIS